MLKKPITYEDFNGNNVTDIYYFHLGKAELTKLQHSEGGGFAAVMEKLIEAKDEKALFEQFERIILLSYGEKSADGKSFVKTEELRDAFRQTAAFDALFVELATGSDNAVAFLNGILPKDMQLDIQNMKSTLAPPPPPAGRQIVDV